MASSLVSRDRVTIPAEMRHVLGIVDGQRAYFAATSDGFLVIGFDAPVDPQLAVSLTQPKPKDPGKAKKKRKNRKKRRK